MSQFRSNLSSCCNNIHRELCHFFATCILFSFFYLSIIWRKTGDILLELTLLVVYDRLQDMIIHFCPVILRYCKIYVLYHRSGIQFIELMRMVSLEVSTTTDTLRLRK